MPNGQRLEVASSPDGGNICGENKLFWTKKMSELFFSTGLCLPLKGGLEELAAAFYLLSCGDW